MYFIKSLVDLNRETFNVYTFQTSHEKRGSFKNRSAGEKTFVRRAATFCTLMIPTVPFMLEVKFMQHWVVVCKTE